MTDYSKIYKFTGLEKEDEEFLLSKIDSAFVNRHYFILGNFIAKCCEILDYKYSGEADRERLHVYNFKKIN